LARFRRLVHGQATASGVLVVLLLWLAYFGDADLLSLDAIVLAVPAAVIGAGLLVHLRGLQRRSDEAWDWLRQFEWAWLVFYVAAAVVVLLFGHAWWAAVVALGMAAAALPAQSLLRSPELDAWLDGRPRPEGRFASG
jgi:hypothetical protein